MTKKELYKNRFLPYRQLVKKFGHPHCKIRDAFKMFGIKRVNLRTLKFEKEISKIKIKYRQLIQTEHSLTKISRLTGVSLHSLYRAISRHIFIKPIKRWKYLKSKGLKHCSLCQNNLPISEFYKCSYQEGVSEQGVQKVCKECSKFKMGYKYTMNRAMAGLEKYQRIEYNNDKIIKDSQNKTLATTAIIHLSYPNHIAKKVKNAF